MISICPRLVAGKAVLLKRMRRASVIRARNSWIGGSALPSHKSPRGQQQARKARLDRVRRVSPPRIAGAFHQPAWLMPCEVFSMRCSARRRLDNLRRGCFDTRAETRMPGPATIERAPCRLHRTRQIERLASRMARRVAAGPSINFPLRWALDCGTGLMHGRGQTDRRFAAGIRYWTDSQSKTAGAIRWKVVLCGRMAGKTG